MPARHDIDELRHREYLTPNEAARVFGRSADYFRRLFTERRVAGYPETVARGAMQLTTIYLDAESVRAHFAARCQPVVAEQPARVPTMKELVAQHGARYGIK